MKTVNEKIRDGDYSNAEKYPDLGLRKTNPDVWKELKRQFQMEEKRLTDQFKRDLEEEFHMTKHPLTEHIFNLAWEQGHSYGFHEILNHYEELYVSLVEPMNDYIKKRFNVVFK